MVKFLQLSNHNRITTSCLKSTPKLSAYEVTVQNGEITNINILEHRHERGKTAEAITTKIVDEQRIDVDTISGATNSSTVIKKAVANALRD